MINSNYGMIKIGIKKYHALYCGKKFLCYIGKSKPLKEMKTSKSKYEILKFN
jgi:hypothetical protein